LRLGRDHAHPVEWEEINAALGEVVHLLQCITQLLNIRLTGYELLWRGNYSSINVASDETSTHRVKTACRLYYYSSPAVPLQSTSSMAPTPLLPQHHRDIIPSTPSDLNAGLAALLCVLDQIYLHISTLDSTFSMPFIMAPKDNKIDGLSIFLEHYQNDRWTKAMMHLLINCKYIVAWVTARR
jgi:beclin 1